jgi:hypothetical protein
MKKYLTLVVEFYKKHTSPVKGIYRKKGIRPGTDWKVIVGVFFMLSIVAAGVNLFIYIQVKNNAWWTLDEANTVYQVKINQKMLDDALKRFDEKKNKFEEFKSSNVFVNDPSL